MSKINKKNLNPIQKASYTPPPKKNNNKTFYISKLWQ